MKDTYSKIIALFNKTEKKKLFFLFVMTIFAAIFETIGIGLIIPFIAIITDPNVIHDQAILSSVYELLNFQSTTMFIIFAVVILMVVFTFKNSYLLFFYFMQYKIVLNQQVQLSSKLFKEYLTKPYIFHLQKNSSELIRNVNGEVSKIFQGVILSVFQLITEILVITCILALLVITAPIATITASILLGGSVFIFLKVFQKKISFLGKEQQTINGKLIKSVYQGFGASKEIKVIGNEQFFVETYKKTSQEMMDNSRYIRMLEQIPRLFLETLLVSIVLISMLMIVLQGISTTQLLSTMALFAMAAFRLMPSINRIVALVNTIRYSYPALSVVYEDLVFNNEEVQTQINEEKFSKSKRTYNDSIQLKEVSFQYPNQKLQSIKNVSLTIPIGYSVAFIGESGAGKTTIVDIILGLYTPERGSVIIDGVNLNEQKGIWQQKIGYIPQSIYLSDDTIRGNVAFGVESTKIDDKEVWRALEQAQLKEFVEQLPDQLNTNVGERGVKLSGGQRQRIGIARALYHNPEILFMDEATSALDNETEKEIMKAIDGLKGEKTLVIIAHRLSTIENCDIVFKMGKGQLIGVEHKRKQSVMKYV